MLEVSNVSANEVMSEWGDVEIVSDWLILNLLVKSGSMKYGKKNNFHVLKCLKS